MKYHRVMSNISQNEFNQVINSMNLNKKINMKYTLYTLLFALNIITPCISFSQVEKKVDTISVQIKNLQTKIDSLNQQLKVKDGPFKLSIGASFDFLSGTSKTDLYYDLNFFIPEIWKNDSNKFWKNVGLDFSFYQTRLFGDSIFLSLEQEPKKFGTLNSDTLLAEKYTLSRERKTTLENMGIFLSPTYKIRPNLYALLHFEGIIQGETVYFNDTFTEIDSTLKIALIDYKDPTNPLRKIQQGEKISVRKNDFRGFLGIGFLLDFTVTDVNFRLKPVFGYMKNKPWIRNPREENVEGKFYDISIQIIEKNTGIKLGGEVRNLFDTDDNPNYSIFLSKNFSLSKLGEFIKSK